MDFSIAFLCFFHYKYRETIKKIHKWHYFVNLDTGWAGKMIPEVQLCPLRASDPLPKEALREFSSSCHLPESRLSLDGGWVSAPSPLPTSALPCTAGSTKYFGTAKARYDFCARDRSELSLKEGDIIKILNKKGQQGWWRGEIYGRVSWGESRQPGERAWG